MRTSRLFFPTLREAPRDADLQSHQLLLRGGFIRGTAAGIYSYLPLGWRVHEKISQIVREEINAINGQEVHMPVLVPVELLEESGRAGVSVLFRLKDRNQRDFALGFTHEEVITDIARNAISSWKQLPIYLYQIQTKERDEPRPRGGLIRGREFTMFDGYSFDHSDAGLDSAYAANYAAYSAVFKRCGLGFLAIEADPGAIGGGENHEFMVLAESGEDTVLRCGSCGYAANSERAETRAPEHTTDAVSGPLERVHTPGMRTIDEVGAFLGAPHAGLLKTILCTAGGTTFAAIVRGDRELNLPKLARAAGLGEAALAGAAEVERVTGATVGFAGPSGLGDVPIFMDHEIGVDSGWITGANLADHHYRNATPRRDFPNAITADIRTAVAGDRCARCADGSLETARGIEVGHIFKLGTKYSESMGAMFQGQDGQKRPLIMGCYGLGISRTLAAAVEAHHDGDGMVWPASIAPFQAVIIVANVEDEAQRTAAEAIYHGLLERGVDALLDDRADRMGVKFKDMDLIGIPVQIVVGKALAEGEVEVTLRRDKAGKQRIAVGNIVGHVRTLLDAELAACAGDA